MQFQFPKLLRRSLISILAFFGLFLTNAMMHNMSIAIIAMTKNKPVILENGTTIQKPEFDWNSVERSYILGSMFYGRICIEITGGWLSTKFGGATIFGIGVLGTAIVTITIPFFSNFGIYLVILSRILIGVFEGITHPSLFSLFSKWIPSEENTRTVSYVHLGSNIGTIVGLSTYGLIAYYWNWRLLFYIPGGLTIIWYLIWISNVKNNPTKDTKITQVELEHLNASRTKTSQKTEHCPWMKIMKSKAAWAVICVHCADSWTYKMFLTQLPTFLEDVWKFKIKDVGYLSMIPFIAMGCMKLVAGFGSDYFRTRGICSTTTVRKLFIGISSFGEALLVIMICYVHSPYYVIGLLSMALSCQTLNAMSMFANHLDIAAKYAGLLIGISYTFSGIAATVSTTLVGYIVTRKSKEEWETVFVICGILQLIAAVIYVCFGTSEVQQWAQDKQEDDEAT